MKKTRTQKLSENFKKFYEKAKPVVKAELKQAGKNVYSAERKGEKVIQRGADSLIKSLGKSLNKKLSNKQVLKKVRASVDMREKRIYSNFEAGSPYFSDNWENGEVEDNLLNSNNKLFWG